MIEPSPEVLAEAIDGLRHLGHRPSGPYSWLSRRHERAHSTLLELVDEKNGLTLFYKVLKSDDTEPGSPDSLENRLKRAHGLNERLSRELEGTRATPARVLAVDPGTRTIVTLGLPGRELGKSLAWRRSRRVTEMIHDVGMACAATDIISADYVVEFDLRRLQRDLERQMARLPQSLSRRILEGVMEMITECVRDQGAAYAHGDLSTSNLLYHRGDVGIVDYAWVGRVRGYDLGVFDYRLAQASSGLSSGRRRFSLSLNAGYRKGIGDRYDPTSHWLVNVLMLLRSLSLHHPPPVAYRALDRLMSGKGDSGPIFPPPDTPDFIWWWAEDE